MINSYTKLECNRLLYIILSKDDEVLNYKLAERHFKNKASITIITGGHRINDFTSLKQNIDNAINELKL